ncbi:AraC family transcriptional regulator [Paenibacillus daejeonensis]|uniref:AraC family transcriptional regulator n=1 Tax=Paenibacillus daejeonensis TaxID=135193 RepID=UPI000365B32B|nr:AraC family transcriptional regulator [Paenibacillus daejeonensis]
MLSAGNNSRHPAALEQLSLRLRSIDHLTDSRGHWRLQAQFLESSLLLYIASGQGKLMLDGRFIPLRTGRVYLCGPGQLTEADVHGMSEQGCYVIHFDTYVEEQDGSGFRREMTRDAHWPEEMVAESPWKLLMLCEDLHRSWQSGSSLQRFGAQARFQGMVHELLHQASLPSTDESASLEAAKSYMERHYQHKLAIGDLAAAAQMSERHFMRQFKKRYGYSAMDYLAIHRIREAQTLMKNEPPPPLKEIGSLVGYPEEGYFRRKFRQITGIAPAAFIRNSRQRIVAYHPQVIGILLALQMIPCAAPDSHPWTAYYRRKYHTDRVSPLSDDTETKLMEVRTAEADAIVAIDRQFSEQERQELQSYIRICEISWDNNDWRAHLRMTAHYLGMDGMADIWLARYERKAATIREQLTPTIGGDSLLLLQVTAHGLVVPGDYSMADVFYGDLGMTKPAEFAVSKGPVDMLLPQLAELNVDRLLVIVGEEEQAKERWHAIAISPLWEQLTAVRYQRVNTLDATLLHDYTAFTHDLLLDEVRKLWHDCT